MKCPKCGIEYDDAFNYCPNCSELKPQVLQPSLAPVTQPAPSPYHPPLQTDPQRHSRLSKFGWTKIIVLSGVAVLVLVGLVIGLVLGLGGGVSDEQIKKEYTQFVKSLNDEKYDLSDYVTAENKCMERAVQATQNNQNLERGNFDEDYMQRVQHEFDSSVTATQTLLKQKYSKIKSYNPQSEELKIARIQIEKLVSADEDVMEIEKGYLDASYVYWKDWEDLSALEALEEWTKKGLIASEKGYAAIKSLYTLGIIPEE
jgi:hypothetical protein